MKPWMRTALAVALVLAIAAGGFFLPNLVAARPVASSSRKDAVSPRGLLSAMPQRTKPLP